MWCTGIVFLAGFLYVTVGVLTQWVLSDSAVTVGHAVGFGVLFGALLAVPSFYTLRLSGRQFPSWNMDSTARPSLRFWQLAGVALFAASLAGAVVMGGRTVRADDDRIAAQAAPASAHANTQGQSSPLQAVEAANPALGRESDEKAAVSPSSRPAWKLAVIDQGGKQVLALSDLQAYGAVMDRLIDKCPEPEERISDFAVVGTKGLSERGVSMTNFEFLVAMDKSMPADVKAKLGVKCAETAAILATLIEKH